PMGQSLAPHPLLQIGRQVDDQTIELALGEGKPANHRKIGWRNIITTATFAEGTLPAAGNKAGRYTPTPDTGRFQLKELHPDVIVLGSDDSSIPLQWFFPKGRTPWSHREAEC